MNADRRIVISMNDPDGPGIAAYCLPRPTETKPRKRATKGTTACLYNEGVVCSDHKCDKCGFRKEQKL